MMNWKECLSQSSISMDTRSFISYQIIAMTSTDITYCVNGNCPLQDKCIRWDDNRWEWVYSIACFKFTDIWWKINCDFYLPKESQWQT